jgi:hypothetical protein
MHIWLGHLHQRPFHWLYNSWTCHLSNQKFSHFHSLRNSLLVWQMVRTNVKRRQMTYTRLNSVASCVCPNFLIAAHRIFFKFHEEMWDCHVSIAWETLSARKCLKVWQILQCHIKDLLCENSSECSPDPGEINLSLFSLPWIFCVFLYYTILIIYLPTIYLSSMYAYHIPKAYHILSEFIICLFFSLSLNLKTVWSQGS